MRVIAGDLKGRKLLAPKGTNTRPTSGRVKEAVFSMIQPLLQDAVCLDLFAGSGALGIEALSRGAARVYFCEIDPVSLNTLTQNLNACGLNERASILKADWRVAILNIREKCDLVFIDAPYEKCEYYSGILNKLGNRGCLKEGATVVVERRADAAGYSLPGGFERVREKHYGNIGVDLLIYAGEDE